MTLGPIAPEVSAQAYDAPEDKAPITLSDADRASMNALDAAIKRFDALMAKVTDVHEKAAVKAFLDAIKNRAYALRRNFDQALFDTLRLDTEIEYQRMIAWLADPVPTRHNRRDIDIPEAISTREGGIASNELSAAEKAAGWKLLWDGRTLKGWRGYRMKGLPFFGWEVQGDTLHAVATDKSLKAPFEALRHGELITEQKYTDFELSWDWRVPKGGNSGLKYLVTEERPNAPGIEFQMMDDLANASRGVSLGSTGGMYAILPPAADTPYKPAGEWNTSKIIVRGKQVEHWHNGKLAVAYELGSPQVKAGIEKSKFKTEPAFGEKIAGHIMLTYHGDEAWVRNIKIRELK